MHSAAGWAVIVATSACSTRAGRVASSGDRPEASSAATTAVAVRSWRPRVASDASARWASRWMVSASSWPSTAAIPLS